MIRVSVAAACLCASGCVTIGPDSIRRDRYDYGAEIGYSWKQQTLVNLVRLRYLDMPVFLDVGQIVGGYTLESGLTARASISPQNPDSWSIDGTGRYTDRPTITYSPMTGNQFLRSMMTPVSPESLLFTIQSNWPADLVMGLTLGAINGYRNQQTILGDPIPADPEFLRIARFLRKLQSAAALEMRIREGRAGERPAMLLLLRNEHMTSQLMAEAREIKMLLKLDPDRNEFRLVYGAVSHSPDEIALQTRSMLHVMAEVSAVIDAPERDISARRAAQGMAGVGAVPPIPLRIRSQEERPRDSFVSVRYRDHWFYIADDDLPSKAVFTFLMLMFTLADNSERQALPLITIPAG